MPNTHVPELIPALPELFLAVTIMSLLMFGVFQKRGRDEQDITTFRYVTYMGIVALLLAVLLTTLLAG